MACGIYYLLKGFHLLPLRVRRTPAFLFLPSSLLKSSSFFSTATKNVPPTAAAVEDTAAYTAKDCTTLDQTIQTTSVGKTMKLKSSATSSQLSSSPRIFSTPTALKYSTAVPVIFLSALKYHVFPDRWTNIYHPLWLLSSILNSWYSFYWDVTRDWDLSVFSRIFEFKNPNLCSSILYGRQWVYYWAIRSNLVLRCTWTYKLSAHLRHNYSTVLTFTALEMLRRFQWVFFRVENEWNKMALKPSLQVSLSELPKEDDRLLDSDDHFV